MPICFVLEPLSCGLAVSLLSSAWMMSGRSPVQLWLEQVRITTETLYYPFAFALALSTVPPSVS
jgi:hypothetical protein